jgi:hypothetical protein
MRCDRLLGQSVEPIGPASEADIDLDIVAIRPTEALEAIPKGLPSLLLLRIVLCT